MAANGLRAERGYPEVNCREGRFLYDVARSVV